MEKQSRRSILKQMTAATLASSFMLEGCGIFSRPKATTQTPKSLNPLYIPAGTFKRPQDGTTPFENDRTGPKVRMEHTNSQMCCAEIYLMPKKAAAPPHLHKELDEVMRVVEGTVHMLIGDKIIELHAGDWHIRPHGIVHTFWNATEKPALVIDIYPNQDFLSFFEDTERLRQQLASRGTTFQSAEGQSMFNALLQKYGIESFPELFPPIIQRYGLTI